MNKLISLFFLFICISYSEAHSDSLWTLWENPEAHDTIRLEALNAYIWSEYLYHDPDSAYIQAQKQYDFAEYTGYIKYKGQALSIQGLSFALNNADNKALSYYLKSLTFFEEAADAEGIAYVSNNIAEIYLNQGAPQKAIESYIKCLKIMQDLEEFEIVAKTQSDIGSIYSDQADYIQAVNYLTQSLNTSKKLKDADRIVKSNFDLGVLFSTINEHETAIHYFKKAYNSIDGSAETELEITASILNKLGSSYFYLGENTKALDYYMAGLGVKERLGNLNDFALTLNDIGTIYFEKNEWDKAENYFYRSLNSIQVSKEVADIVYPLTNIARLHLLRKEYIQAIKIADQCLEIARNKKDYKHIEANSYILYESYKALGNNNKAFKMLELYTEIDDSLYHEKSKKEMIQHSFNYEYDKKRMADSLIVMKEKINREAYSATKKARLEKERIKLFALSGGTIILIVFGGFMYNRRKESQKQKSIIKKQKQQVENQQLELSHKTNQIIDSNSYAKKIQSTILPPIWMLKKHLIKSFVLYIPKEQVSGDFYWFRKVGDSLFFAVADCTGHGVPGAMISVICNHALNRSIREFQLIEPGEILDKTLELVVKEFEKADEEIKEGMDIALCAINDNKLSFAGANLPLWIIRNNKLTVIKGNKQAIAKHPKPAPFTSHHFEIQKGDCLYMLSDGFADQFGGPSGKKFKTKALQEFILSIQGRNMKDQKLLLNNAFRQWKGDLEHVDDICIIGCRI